MGCKILFAIGICCVFPSLSAHGQDVVGFGVFPFFPPNRLEARVGPLIRALSQELNRPVQFKTRGSFEAFSEALLNEDFEIALIQPFDYVKIRSTTRYRPLVRNATPLQARFVTADSSVNDIGDLRGKVIGFPSASAAVTLIAIRDLQDVGIGTDQFTPRFFNEHSSCLLSAINGQSEACVTVQTIVSAEGQTSNLRTIHTSEGIPHILIVYREGVFEDVEGLRKWFLKLNEQADTLELLNNAQLFRLATTTDADYDIVADIYQQTLAASRYVREHGVASPP